MLNTLDLFWRAVPPLWHMTRALTFTIATEEFGITPSKFHALRRIVQGQQYVSQLADSLHLSRPNISRMVDELVNEGYISRQPDLQDRRNVKLILTDKGRNLFDTLHKRIQKQMVALFSRLSDNELLELERGLINMQKLVDLQESPFRSK